MMKKQKYKSHFFRLDREIYDKLRDYGFRNSDILVLTQNPSKFFAYFQKYSKYVPDEQKDTAYMFCLKAILNKSRKEETWEIYSKSF